MTDTVLDEVLAELEEEDPICEACRRPMPSRGQWDRADAAERADLLEDGYVSPRGHGCETPRHLPRGYRLNEEARKATSVFWARYIELYRQNPSSRSIARAMGVDRRAVARRVERASRGEL